MATRGLLALLAGALLGGMTLAACDDQPPPSPVPITAGPGPVNLAAAVFLLRADQVPGYKRSNSTSLTPELLAAAQNDPTIAATLTAEGFVEGARWTYSAPQPRSKPFDQVISQAIVFSNVAGATKNLADEGVRQNKPPGNGGTIHAVTDLAPAGVDQVVVLVSNATQDGVQVQSFLAIARRGRVVVELFAIGETSTATEANYSALLTDEAQLLGAAPTA